MSVIHFETLPVEIPNNAQVSINTTRVTPITHGFHKYPGKFIPQIPEWAIQAYLKDEKAVVLDPFVGSGTSLVESMVAGYESYGIDIDPLSCMISKVKSTPLNIDDFAKVSEWILVNMYNIEPVFEPKTENIKHWFTGEAIEKLRKIRTLINNVPEQFKEINGINDIYDALLIAYSGIIRRVSNADNQSQKTYVSHTKIKIPAEVYSLFTKQLLVFKKGLTDLKENWNGKVHSSLIQSDGRADFSGLVSVDIDLIVTSPPYIKSIDYVYNQMVELFWVGDLFDMDTQVSQNEKRKKYTGTTLVRKTQYDKFFDDNKDLGVEELNQYIRQIFDGDEKNGEKHAYIVYRYFEFMAHHFVGASKVMKNGAHYVMAVGNSSVSGIEIDTAGILIELASKAGLTLDSRWSYIIKNHFMGFDRGNKGGKINIDHMLIFRK